MATEPIPEVHDAPVTLTLSANECAVLKSALTEYVESSIPAMSRHFPSFTVRLEDLRVMALILRRRLEPEPKGPHPV